MSSVSRKRDLFENLLRMRRVARALPKNDDVSAVRIFLESELGETVSQRLAASILGVSHTGLRRWFDSGDLPLVYTNHGRLEVPVGALLEIRESVDEVRAAGHRRLHVIEPIVQRNRRHARQLRSGAHGGVVSSNDRRLDHGHRKSELFALAYHQALARTLEREQVEEARHVLRRWVAQERIAPYYANAWEHLLDRTVPEIRRTISTDTQEMRDLRQNSPFAGLLSEPERREIIRLSS